MGLDAFVGNPKTAGRIREKLRQNRFPHSVILSGPDGVGKHTLARMIAKSLNCPVAGPADFCDECPQCLKINAGTHPDVLTITLEEEATRIRIAQIRKLLSILEMQPLEGRSKVFVIDPANLLNEESANALLKALEEPPDNSFFILVAVRLHDLLVTIRSRSQTYQFAPLTLDEIRREGVSDELAVRWSQGSIGRARTLDLAVIKAQRDIVIRFLETAVRAREESLRDLLPASAELARARQDFNEHLAVMTVVLADLIHLKEGALDRIVNIDIQDHLNDIASGAPAERWIRIAEFLREIEESLKSNANRQILTDALAIESAGLADRSIGTGLK